MLSESKETKKQSFVLVTSPSTNIISSYMSTLDEGGKVCHYTPLVSKCDTLTRL